MDEGLGTLEDVTVFTTLDCNSENRPIHVAEEGIAKTNFTCHVATNSFRKGSFGLMDAPAPFRPMLDILRSEYQWKAV